VEYDGIQQRYGNKDKCQRIAEQKIEQAHVRIRLLPVRLFLFRLVSFYAGTVKAELCNATQGSRDYLDRAASILHSGRSFAF
jgi:hypothetical protein